LAFQRENYCDRSAVGKSSAGHSIWVTMPTLFNLKIGTEQGVTPNMMKQLFTPCAAAGSVRYGNKYF
jgi:hypothetical protein